MGQGQWFPQISWESEELDRLVFSRDRQKAKDDTVFL